MSEKQYLVALTNQSEGRVDVHDLSMGVIDESSLVRSHCYDHPAIAGVKLRRPSRGLHLAFTYPSQLFTFRTKKS